MSWLSEKLGIRSIRQDDPKDSYLTKEIEDLIDNTPELINKEDLDKFRTIATDRDALFEIYDDMLKDITIASAIEMYADDATQYDNSGRVIWVTSDDEKIARAGNRLLNVLRIPENSWSYIYSLVLYGDLYLETFRDTNTYDIVGNKLVKDDVTSHHSYNDILMERYARTSIGSTNKVSLELDTNIWGSMKETTEMVDDPSTVYDLTKNGNTVGYIRLDAPPKDENGIVQYTYNINQVIVQDPTKYIHISLAPEITRHPETITLVRDNGDSKLADKLTFKVKKGKSVLHDVYKIHQELSLLEDSLLLNRLVRSAIVRVLQVEVGDMPKNQVQQLLGRIKRMFEQKTAMNTATGEYKNYNSPAPSDNIVYVPTRAGKGQINASTIGGDVDIKSISDLDYFNNKLFGGLKIPKQYLGFTDDMAGFNGGQSLLRLDSRYAKTIKKIQTAYIAGITTLLNVFFIDKKLDSYVGNFQVKMVSPSTADDLERDEMLSNRTRTTGDLLGLFGDITDEKTRLQILRELLVTNIDNPTLADIVQNYIDNYDNMKALEDEATNDLPDLGSDGGDLDLDLGSTESDAGGPELPEVTDDLVNDALGGNE